MQQRIQKGESRHGKAQRYQKSQARGQIPRRKQLGLMKSVQRDLLEILPQNLIQLFHTPQGKSAAGDDIGTQHHEAQTFKARGLEYGRIAAHRQKNIRHRSRVLFMKKHGITFGRGVRFEIQRYTACAQHAAVQRAGDLQRRDAGSAEGVIAAVKHALRHLYGAVLQPEGCGTPKSQRRSSAGQQDNGVLPERRPKAV